MNTHNIRTIFISFVLLSLCMVPFIDTHEGIIFEHYRNIEGISHYFGVYQALDTTNDRLILINLTIEKEVKKSQDLNNGRIKILEISTAVEEETGLIVSDLYTKFEFELDEDDFELHRVKDEFGNIVKEYPLNNSASTGVYYTFPPNVEKIDYRIWNQHFLDFSITEYQGIVDLRGIDCYEFLQIETDREVTVPEVLRTNHSEELFDNAEITYSIIERFYVDPDDGGILDRDLDFTIKVIYPELPEIRYPEDFNLDWIYSGYLTIFDQYIASFKTHEDIMVSRHIENVQDENEILTLDDIINVETNLSEQLDLLCLRIQVEMDPYNGKHVGKGRTGQFLFPPNGVEERDYSFWNDGFGGELTAKFMGTDKITYYPLTANVFKIHVENSTYMSGGIATLEETYYVEPETGIILDSIQNISNWRPQQARRLPLDTEMLNETKEFDMLVTVKDPTSQIDSTFNYTYLKNVRSHGYSDVTFSTALFEEIIDVVSANGSSVIPSKSARYGVNAVTMSYVDVDDWSDVDRDGLFQPPFGIIDTNGHIHENLLFFDHDLGLSINANYKSKELFHGFEAANYISKVENITIENNRARKIAIDNLPLENSEMDYSCTTKYLIDINTGIILDYSKTIILSNDTGIQIEVLITDTEELDLLLNEVIRYTNLLQIADGLEPALDLHIKFSHDTIEKYKSIAEETRDYIIKLKEFQPYRKLLSEYDYVLEKLSFQQFKPYGPERDGFSFENYGGFLASGGHCYGMSEVSLLLFYDMYEIDEFDTNAEDIYTLDYDNVKLRSFIKLHQIRINNWITSSKIDEDYNQFIEVKFLLGRLRNRDPIILGFKSSEYGFKHAVVAYGIERYDVDKYKIFLYDSNYPAEERIAFMRINMTIDIFYESGDFVLENETIVNGVFDMFITIEPSKLLDFNIVSEYILLQVECPIELSVKDKEGMEIGEIHSDGETHFALIGGYNFSDIEVTIKAIDDCAYKLTVIQVNKTSTKIIEFEDEIERDDQDAYYLEIENEQLVIKPRKDPITDDDDVTDDDIIDDDVVPDDDEEPSIEPPSNDTKFKLSLFSKIAIGFASICTIAGVFAIVGVIGLLIFTRKRKNSPNYEEKSTQIKIGGK